jgi:hypothetical protein
MVSVVKIWLHYDAPNRVTNPTNLPLGWGFLNNNCATSGALIWIKLFVKDCLFVILLMKHIIEMRKVTICKLINVESQNHPKICMQVSRKMIRLWQIIFFCELKWVLFIDYELQSNICLGSYALKWLPSKLHKLKVTTFEFLYGRLRAISSAWILKKLLYNFSYFLPYFNYLKHNQLKKAEKLL